MRNSNVERLRALFERCEMDGNWSDLLSRDRRSLCRNALLLHCGFPRSTLYQNRAVKTLLAEQESNLQARNILCAAAEGQADLSVSSESLALLSERASVACAELAKFRARLDALVGQIDRILQG